MSNEPQAAATTASTDSAAAGNKGARWRGLLMALGLAVLAALCLLVKPHPYNVVIIGIDSLRADAVGAGGNPDALTPNIDALARSSAQFVNAITTAPWGCPAWGSLLSGLYPEVHGSDAGTLRDGQINGLPLDMPIDTLARVLIGEGYVTAAMVTSPSLSPQLAMGHGFEIYLFEARSAKSVTDWAIEWLQGADREKQFLLFLEYGDAAPPHDPPGLFRHSALDGQAPLPESFDPWLRERVVTGEAGGKPGLDEQVKRLYQAEVAMIDGQIGRVFAELAALNLAKETIIVLVSNHGIELWERGGYGFGHSLAPELLRIPLLIRLPNARAGHGRLDGQPASIADVAPTILGFLNRAQAQRMQGRTLLSPPSALQAAELSRLAGYPVYGPASFTIIGPEQATVFTAGQVPQTYDLAADPGAMNPRPLTAAADEQTAADKLLRLRATGADFRTHIGLPPRTAGKICCPLPLDWRPRRSASEQSEPLIIVPERSGNTGLKLQAECQDERRPLRIHLITSTGVLCSLIDGGQHGDAAADDGIYSVSWTDAGYLLDRYLIFQAVCEYADGETTARPAELYISTRTDG